MVRVLLLCVLFSCITAASGAATLPECDAADSVASTCPLDKLMGGCAKKQIDANAKCRRALQRQVEQFQALANLNRVDVKMIAVLLYEAGFIKKDDDISDIIGEGDALNEKTLEAIEAYQKSLPPNLGSPELQDGWLRSDQFVYLACAGYHKDGLWSTYYLGYLYATGQGVPYDPGKAYYLLNAARSRFSERRELDKSRSYPELAKIDQLLNDSDISRSATASKAECPDFTVYHTTSKFPGVKTAFDGSLPPIGLGFTEQPEKQDSKSGVDKLNSP